MFFSFKYQSPQANPLSLSPYLTLIASLEAPPSNRAMMGIKPAWWHRRKKRRRRRKKRRKKKKREGGGGWGEGGVISGHPLLYTFAWPPWSNKKSFSQRGFQVSGPLFNH
ncbi:rCG37910, isoform CRA_a [Rattus norvegicus]|uniref:RCG37910, isoform CRA_a n=1 Tax=Rattus norvegicus TaxID=10116 RepID=A6K5P9_RAT|nr:rCG37910, isoform CRA_a [Rattus norvegicus]